MDNNEEYREGAAKSRARAEHEKAMALALVVLDRFASGDGPLMPADAKRIADTVRGIMKLEGTDMDRGVEQFFGVASIEQAHALAERKLDAVRPKAHDRSFGCLNDDLYSELLAGREYQPIASRPLEGGGCEYQFRMPEDHRLDWDQSWRSGQDAINEFWNAMAGKMNFVWTTVADAHWGTMTFWAQIEQPTEIPDTYIDVSELDPADAYMARYVGMQDAEKMRFSKAEMIEAFKAGQAEASMPEYEIDGEMMPADLACEHLLAKLGRLLDGIEASLQPIRPLVGEVERMDRID